MKTSRWFLAMVAAALSIPQCSFAQQLAIQWQKCLGGEAAEDFRSIAQTFDGGYILVSSTPSVTGEVSGNHGGSDYWVAKVSNAGILEWEKCLGGSGDEFARSVIQSSDGGYVVAGFSNSIDGDVTGNHGFNDFWIVKLDSTGALLWQRSLGGTQEEWAASVVESPSGNYFAAGFTRSNNGDVSHNLGMMDEWVVELDNAGNLLWQNCLGGSANEAASCIINTADGGLMVVGDEASTDGQVSNNHGMEDIWLVKLDSTLNIEWEKSYGGSDHDNSVTVIQTSSGGYCVTGYTLSNNDDVTGNHGGYDGWIVNVDATGNLLWQKTLGGSADDFMNSVIEDSSGTYIVCGNVNSVDSGITNNHGLTDLWIAILNSNGSLNWQKCFGGTGFDGGNSIIHASDGGYVVGGGSSSNNGDVSGNHGNWDDWLVKLDYFAAVQENSLEDVSVYPNPVTDMLTIENAGRNLRKIEVNDLTGNNLFNLNPSAEAVITVGLSLLSKGVYFLVLTGEKNSRTVKKVVKM